MGKLFREYGLAALVVITGTITVIIMYGLLSNGDLADALFLTDDRHQYTMIGVQDVAKDDEIITQTIEPTLDVRDLIVDYGEVFNWQLKFDPSCSGDTCFDAYVMLNGTKVELKDYVTVELERPIDTNKAGSYQITYNLRWNGYHIRSERYVHVLEDPNATDFDNEAIKGNYVRGLIGDESCKPVEAKIQIYSSNEDGSALVYSGMSNQYGEFMIYGLKSGVLYDVLVLGHDDIIVPPFFYEGGGYNLDVLSPGACASIN
ncbi:MAG: hypothetical protein J6K75_08700 [Erysipelotrichaceae bacterium]|nr:hypothetical protein [Erysipelotrichaceae bacterium]